MLFVRFLQLLPPAPPQSLCRFADAAYPREGTETTAADGRMSPGSVDAAYPREGTET